MSNEPKPFLLEIGVEELPVSFLDSALEALPRLFAEMCRRQRIRFAAAEALGSPRRLALYVSELATQQDDLDEERIGPPESVAFSTEGALRPAGEAFLKKNEASRNDLYFVDQAKGRYLALRHQRKGERTVDVLMRELANVCEKVPFPKTMRWGKGDLAFGRPVHWLVGLYATDVVSFSFAGSTSSRTSRGHRFLSDETFDLAHADDYKDLLMRHHVHVDPKERESVTRRMVADAANRASARPVEDSFLLHENAGLVEKPHAMVGSFDRRFLELPEDVVIAVLRDHQRYFAMRDARDERLVPHYVVVANTANQPQMVVAGNDRVLRARLEDAEFFVLEDGRRGLKRHAEKLEGLVFHHKLGSVAAKTRRLTALSEKLAQKSSKEVQDACRSAASLCKADLTTLTVGEFPELQGTFGGWLAAKEGMPQATCEAIAQHYRPSGAADAAPTSVTSGIVALADKLDTLVGCFGIGLVPSGSADPFALRRAALGVIRIALESSVVFNLEEALRQAIGCYDAGTLNDEHDVIEKLMAFFRKRLEVLLRETAESRVVDACLHIWDGGSIAELRSRVSSLEEISKQSGFEALATAFKRAYNITEEAPRTQYRVDLFVGDEERALAEALEKASLNLDQALAEDDFTKAQELIISHLAQPIDRFFENVYVMDDDAAVRANRLALLRSVANAVRRVAAFERLV